MAVARGGPVVVLLVRELQDVVECLVGYDFRRDLIMDAIGQCWGRSDHVTVKLLCRHTISK